jgi:hypothetical protein
MDSIGNRSQSFWKTIFFDRPVADILPPVTFIPSASCIPACIEPENLRNDFELLVTLYQGDCIIGCQAIIFITWGGVTLVKATGERVLSKFPVNFPEVMGEDKLPEPVMPFHPVFSLPE